MTKIIKSPIIPKKCVSLFTYFVAQWFLSFCDLMNNIFLNSQFLKKLAIVNVNFYKNESGIIFNLHDVQVYKSHFHT